MNRAARIAEIDSNYDAFQRVLVKHLKSHESEFALLRKGEIIAFFPTVSEAASEAAIRFQDQVYSIQQVVQDPIDLGFFTHAGS